MLVSTGALNLNIAGLDDSRVCQIEVPLLTVAETKNLLIRMDQSRTHICSFMHIVVGILFLCEHFANI